MSLFSTYRREIGVERERIAHGAQVAIQFPERTKHLILMVPAAYVRRPDGAPSVTPPSGLTFLFDTALRSDFLFWALLRGAPKLATRVILATPPEVVAAASLAEQARVAELMHHILPVSPRRLGLHLRSW